MIGDFKAYYLDEQTFKTAIEANKKFEPNYITTLTVTILQHYNEKVFEGTICNDNENITTRNERNSYIIDNYNKKQTAAFTFDGISFFKIISTKNDKQRLKIFTFEYISTQSFAEKNTAFMVMPFKTDRLQGFYEKNIKIFLRDCDLKIKVIRADDITGTDVVADTILEQIRKAEFIICDITDCNKNVFFEIGYAKGINKDVIFLLEQNKPDNFFDNNHIRRIEYSYQQPDKFQNSLRETLVSVRNTKLL